MAADIAEIEHRLWRTADQLRANSGLRPSEYLRPVLGLLFLRYADAIFAKAEKALKPKPGSRLKPDADAFKARGVIYLPPEARFSYLRDLPEGANLGRALNDAMTDIEKTNPELLDTLPKNYQEVPNNILVELIKLLDPVDLEGDAFGKVYEFMMGEFAMQEMQKGGEFYTPAAIVRLIVEITEPYRGRILDPACGSGGMFVHSANFVREHKHEPGKELSLFGIEKTRETLRLAKMNLAIHGLSGEIKEANSYYEDAHDCVGKFDFVMANPPFNVNDVDKAKARSPRGDEVLFIDARRIFRQIDRAHRDFTPAQIEFLANIVRLWRGSATFFDDGSKPEIDKHFPKGKYQDVAGLCRRAPRQEIAAQGWSLNPGRYVGVVPGEADDTDFRKRLEELQEELEKLGAEAATLQARIAQNVAELLDK